MCRLTYVSLNGKHIYKAGIMDLYSRKIIGWHLSRHIDTKLTLKALNNAIKARTHPTGLKGLVHHSDRGVQYLAKEYLQTLTKHGIKGSMSRKANPYDNAHMESFMKIFKTEGVNTHEYTTFNEAYDNIKQFINYYNQKRIHSAINISHTQPT